MSRAVFNFNNNFDPTHAMIQNVKGHFPYNRDDAPYGERQTIDSQIY